MTLDVQVPTKIVIVGTSSMSLNDRFSKLKKVVVPAAKQVVRPSRKSLLTAAARQSRSNLAVEEDEYEEALMDEDMLIIGNEHHSIEEEVYDPTYAAVRRTRNPMIARPRAAVMYRTQHVPLQDRISFAPQPYRVAPYSNGFAHNHGRAGFRSNYGVARSGFRHNPNYGRLTNGGFQSRYQNNGGFPPRYGTRGRGGARGGFQKKQLPKKSQEELDRELDEYMTKPGAGSSSKHAQITMDGLE